MDPIELFERATSGATAVIASVRPEQMAGPTPCEDWDVAALIEHLRTGPDYLLSALGHATDPALSYEQAVAACLPALREPGAMEVRCMSPAGFEWSVAEATMGTAMDQLVHTWDLAVAVGADATLDDEAVAVVVSVFLPEMPEVGRRAGLVGPEVIVAPDASEQDRLLGAMGRTP